MFQNQDEFPVSHFDSWFNITHDHYWMHEYFVYGHGQEEPMIDMPLRVDQVWT